MTARLIMGPNKWMFPTGFMVWYLWIERDLQERGAKPAGTTGNRPRKGVNPAKYVTFLLIDRFEAVLNLHLILYTYVYSR